MGSCCLQKNQVIPYKAMTDKMHSKKTSGMTCSENNTRIGNMSPLKQKSISFTCKKKERTSLLSIPNDHVERKSFTFLPISKDIIQAIYKLSLDIKEKTIKLKEYIIFPPEDYMICQVCEDILINPILCSKCNLFICSHCFDNTKIICNHSSNEDPPDYYLNIINVLLLEDFKCFNWKKGCNYLLNYRSIKFNSFNNAFIIKHEKECDYTLKRCYNPKCKYEGDYNDYIIHVRRCHYRMFMCFHCKETFGYNDKASHPCFSSKQNEFSLPLRYCKCGEVLDWNDDNKSENDFKTKNEKEQVKKYYYKCNECNEYKNEKQSPLPISKVCGCFNKLKGGIIKQCSACMNEGGIGWSCHQCFNNLELCENCLSHDMEINQNI